MLNLGLIGFGAFGQFAARHLRHHVHLFVYDLRDLRKKAASFGLTWATLEEAASCQAVLLAVPIAEMPTVLAQVVPYLRPGALLIDVCSVKMVPLDWMLAAAPAEVEVLGTHPLFGPRSGRAGIEGLTVVLCPARTRRLPLVQRLLEEMGLRCMVVSAEEHDRQMAHAQALTHFVARGLAAAGISSQELETPSYSALRRIVENLSRDSDEMFRGLHAYNPFAGAARARLLEEFRRLQARLEDDQA